MPTHGGQDIATNLTYKINENKNRQCLTTCIKQSGGEGLQAVRLASAVFIGGHRRSSRVRYVSYTQPLSVS
ncbi:MAG TPA: hypothetical protein DCE80_10660 [Ignavibacteriales bacterium]|nr:hypothetical protein [Ignavibacteriales bacterium]